MILRNQCIQLRCQCIHYTFIQVDWHLVQGAILPFVQYYMDWFQTQDPDQDKVVTEDEQINQAMH